MKPRPAPPLARPSALALPSTAERMRPWLAAAAAIGVATLGAVVALGGLTPKETAVLLVPLVTSLTMAALAAVRTGRAEDAIIREERARPARDQLLDLDVSAAPELTGNRTYVDGMERWAGAMLELVEHALDVASEPGVRQELHAAAEDIDALRSLLMMAIEREPSLSETATLHSVCSLWETNQDRIEQLASDLDPAWYRRWRGRSVTDRLLRHGPLAPPELVLPYRA